MLHSVLFVISTFTHSVIISSLDASLSGDLLRVWSQADVEGFFHKQNHMGHRLFFFFRNGWFPILAVGDISQVVFATLNILYISSVV